MKNEAEVSTLKMPAPDHIIAGRYRIISRLGSGGMGLVFLAQPVNGGEQVALKFLDPESGDEARLERFLNEAKVAVTMQHPNAPQIYDLGRDEEDRLFIAFELVQGEDLRELLRREGRLTWSEARDIILQIADALGHAHDHHIVHRDIKPENLRVRRTGAVLHVKVLDFGIARLLRNAGVRLTGEGMLAGTPRYMAPEQVKDEPLDGRTDIYALGLVFYEMLTGAIAMGGRNVAQILMHQVQTPMPTLKWADPALDFPQVDAFIARACAKSPNERFASMQEFARELQKLDVDETRWPKPTPNPHGEPLGGAVPTKDEQPQQPPAGSLSDTYVKPLPKTELEPVYTPPPSEAATTPSRPAVPRALQLTESKVVEPAPALEAPTIPERPMVQRPRPPRPVEKQTVLNQPVPKRPASKWPVVLLGVVLGGASLAFAAWWWTHR